MKKPLILVKCGANLRKKQVSKEEMIVLSGRVEEVLPNTMFRVKLEESGHVIICYLGGKLRQHNIKILMGDNVEVEMSPYDMSRGRVIYRTK
jgi:translation initiation factor IF-1